MFRHENLDTARTQSTDAFRARIRILEQRNAMAGSTVDLDVLRAVDRGGVGQPARPNVEVLSAFATLNGRERLNHILVVRGRCQGLL